MPCTQWKTWQREFNGLKHLAANFVTPYGPTKDVPSTQTIWNRLQTFNCELL